ncbi:MAG: hypothetical protein MSIBF_02720 [Candidatus Altiarchaeales archaeon IMC4]|nr:MAG: hypothetical protein MSIBF_02720 [Candidatus Altiarchaeales archaeon IMC4]
MVTDAVLICAIGNRIMGDDGFAQHVLEYIEKNIKLPGGVETGDYSTASLSMANFLGDYKAVIFVDAVRKKSKPGTIHEFEINADEIRDDMNPLEDLFSFSLHESGLEEMLLFAKAINQLPKKIYVIGCEPKEIKPTLELSGEVKPMVEKVAKRAVELAGKIKNNSRQAPVRAKPLNL